MRWLLTFRGVAFGVAAMILTAGSARAEQMVLFDITYTHTGERNFHHEVKAPTLMQPDNWTAPINYAMGTIHFYQEVETKPTPRVTIIDFCFISNPGYGCIETLPYTKTGINETMRSMAPGGDWYQRNQINFTRKIGSVELVIRTPRPTPMAAPAATASPARCASWPPSSRPVAPTCRRSQRPASIRVLVPRSPTPAPRPPPMPALRWCPPTPR